jgi:hypothetical protein
MTDEQQNSFTKYRINHDETNRQSLHDWQVRCLARQILIDAGKNIGATSDGSNTGSK